MPPLISPANRKWWTLAAVAVSLFMIMLDNTVVTVALPDIQADLGSDVTQLEWILNAYVMTFSVFLLTGGKLADMLGRRRIFLAGVALFTLASLLCGLAGTTTMLIAARALQGCGAALMLPATVSIISTAFPPNQRGLALGIWSGISGAGLALGPLIGGALVESAGWAWVFYINIPVGIAGIVAALFAVQESRDRSSEQRLDIPGLVTSGAAIFLAIYGLIEANRLGWSSTVILLCFAGSLVAIVAFVVIELRQRVGLFDISLFRDPTYAAANVIGLVIMLALFGFIFFLSLYLQNVLGYSPLEAGATFLVATGAIMFVAPISGKVSDEIGPRVPMAVGITLFGVAFLMLRGTIGTETTFMDLAPWLALGGFGFGMVMPPATSAVLATVPIDKTGVASGVMQALRQFGGGLGVALMGAIMVAQVGELQPNAPGYPEAFVGGFRDVLLLAALACALGAVTAVVGIRRRASLVTAFETAQPAFGVETKP